MKVIITREQAARIVGGERELRRRILGQSDELARLRGGVVKLFSRGRLGPKPTFELIGSSDGEDVQEIIKALERGESGLLCGSVGR